MADRRHCGDAERMRSGDAGSVYLCELAADGATRRLRARGQLSPLRMAVAALSPLPRPLARSLFAILRARGWLRAEAHVPFDVLDRPDGPIKLRGAEREIVRLALFGPGGQGELGKPHEFRHRQALFTQFSAEIQREAIDEKTLNAAASRALNDSDVRSDPALLAMLRAFVAEQEANVRGQRGQPAAGTSQLRQAFSKPAFVPAAPTRTATQQKLERLAMQFEQDIAQFDLEAARAGLRRIHDLQGAFPAHVDSDAIQPYDDAVTTLEVRIHKYRHQLDELAHQALCAAHAEDQPTAAWLLRRLWAVHALFPALLTESKVKGYRERVNRIAEERENRESARTLLMRERAVAAEIKQLAAAIHEFHRVTHNVPHESETYRAAEADYARAVRAVRAHDAEWLAGLMLELETILDDMRDPAGHAKAEAQVDRFLASVRSALRHLRDEIRTPAQ